LEQNPEFAKEVVPATNINELQTMYNRYAVEDVQYVETKNESMAKSKKSDVEDVVFEESKTGSNVDFTDNDDSSFTDPFNRDNPIVRDYVLGGDSFSESEAPKVDPFATFAEPTNFREAFEIPGSEEEIKSNNPQSENKDKQQSEKKKPSSEPVNPNWDEMNNGKKKRSTKKFAKYIVEAVCMLSERGFVWYANKDINENKLTEYELNGEMDLTLLITVEGEQEITVKQFFEAQCIRANELAKIPETDKSDLADALAEVMMEKGIGPTPTQELMLITLTIFGRQALVLIELKSQTNGLLNQLRSMNEPSSQRNTIPPPPQPQPESVSESVQEVEYEEPAPQPVASVNINEVVEDYENTDIDKIVETIE
jgi:hypothetical protein